MVLLDTPQHCFSLFLIPENIKNKRNDAFYISQRYHGRWCDRVAGQAARSRATRAFCSCQAFFPLQVEYESIRNDVKIPGTELIVCDNVLDHSAFLQEWFADVKLVVCLARPRSLLAGDYLVFEKTMLNLFHAVCEYQVPHLIMVSHPYVSSFPFGKTPHTKVRMRLEEAARELFNQSSNSRRLTIARITEMSEIGHLFEIAKMLHVWPCLRGYNPRLQPISAHDFAMAITTNYVLGDDSDTHNETEPKFKEILIGGPKVYRFRDIGRVASAAIGKRLPVIPVPVVLVRLLLTALRFLKLFWSRVEGIETVLVLAGTAMAGDSVSEIHKSFGSERLEDYLFDLAAKGDATFVHERIKTPKKMHR